MYKKLRGLIVICAMTIVMSASAKMQEIPETEEVEELYVEAEVQKTELREEAFAIESESVIEESMCIIQIDEEQVRQLEEGLESVNSMLDQITTTYSEENVELEGQIAERLEIIKEEIEAQPVPLEDLQEQYDIAKERLEQYRQMLQSIKDKMATIKLSTAMDVTQTFGFTEEEFIYILRNARRKNGKLIIKNSEMAEKVAKGIVEAMSEYQVNELFAVAVMSFESGYFTSTLVVKYNNFGGMLIEQGKAYHFETPEEGILAAVKCIYSNLKKNNTPNDVNESYCSPHITYDEEGNEIVDVYYWARNVVSIAKSYARGIEKFNQGT